MRYAKFEMKNGDVALARRCYERAVESLGEDGQTVSGQGCMGQEQGLGWGGVWVVYGRWSRDGRGWGLMQLVGLAVGVSWREVA